jgi:hypothetical protein
MTRHDRGGIGWRALIFYGIASAIVAVVAFLSLHFFFERQMLRGELAPEPLPDVVIVTENVDDPHTAAWVTLLAEADFSPRLVTVADARGVDGVLALCNIRAASPKLRSLLEQQIARQGSVALLGSVPQELRDLTGVSTESGTATGGIVISENVSPILARVQPGKEIGIRTSEVFFLEESEATEVDARWKSNARAAIAHLADARKRVIWFGFDPSKLNVRGDRHLSLMLRTAFRWVDGQPVSDGASGNSPTVARSFSPSARVESRGLRLTFSVDRMQDEGIYSVRVTNRGKLRISNPTVKFWLPPDTKHVELIGSWISRRRVELIPVEGENAVLIVLPPLAPNEDRVMRLQVSS